MRCAINGSRERETEFKKLILQNRIYMTEQEKKAE